MAFLILTALAANAAGSISDMGYYRIGTINYFENSFPGCYAFSSCCTAPNCTYYGTIDGSHVNTSDLMAGLWVQIAAAADGEAFTFQAVAPNGTIWGNGSTITYTSSTGCWAWNNGNAADWSFEGTPGLGGGGGNVMCPGAYAAIWAGPSRPCFANGTALSGDLKA